MTIPLLTRMCTDDEIARSVLQWKGPYEDFPGVTRVSQVCHVLARLNFVLVLVTEKERISLFFTSMEQL